MGTHFGQDTAPRRPRRQARATETTCRSRRTPVRFLLPAVTPSRSRAWRQVAAPTESTGGPAACKTTDVTDRIRPEPVSARGPPPPFRHQAAHPERRFRGCTSRGGHRDRPTTLSGDRRAAGCLRPASRPERRARPAAPRRSPRPPTARPRVEPRRQPRQRRHACRTGPDRAAAPPAPVWPWPHRPAIARAIVSLARSRRQIPTPRLSRPAPHPRIALHLNAASKDLGRRHSPREWTIRGTPSSSRCANRSRLAAPRIEASRAAQGPHPGSLVGPILGKGRHSCHNVSIDVRTTRRRWLGWSMACVPRPPVRIATGCLTYGRWSTRIMKDGNAGPERHPVT